MGQRLGSLIGAVGGVVFVLVNAGPLGPAAPALRLAGVLALAAALWLAVVRTRPVPTGPPPPPSALRTYWVCVAAEVVAIPVGAQVLTRVLDAPEAVPAWVVVVVGAHFLPFARVFGAALFTPLALALVAVGVAGGWAAVTVDALAAPAAGVVAGFLLLGFVVVGAVVGRRGPGRSDAPHR